MSDPFNDILAEMNGEEHRLEMLVADVVHEFAVFEESINARMKTCPPGELARLQDERERVESAMGLDELMERLDRVRERIAQLRIQSSYAA